MKIVASVSFLLFVAFGTFAGEWQKLSTDEFLADMKKVSSVLENEENFSVELGYMSYESGKSEIIHNRSTGNLKKSGNEYHSFSMGIHTIQNSKERIVVDSINRIIAVTNPVSEVMKSIAPELSSILFKKTQSIRKKNINGITFYEVVFGESFSIISYDLQVDQRQLMKQVDIVYRKKFKNNENVDVNLRMRILFKNWILDSEFSKSEFSVSRYVRNGNGIYSLMQEYSNYELSDQRVKN